MSDLIFEDPRLVAVYDTFDGSREDLTHYLSIIEELKANSVLDVGSGTGCLACLLSERGLQVTGVEPAKASLDFARTKPYAEKVRWLLGDATTLPEMSVDLAVMTGNVAQVFLTDEAWEKTLIGVRHALQPNGYFVFETRDSARKDWLEWTWDNTYNRLNVPGIGDVESWCEITDASEEFVSFRLTYVFASDGAVIASDSTLRFCEKTKIEESLRSCGYKVLDVREAPDRPGKEFVFITSSV